MTPPIGLSSSLTAIVVLALGMAAQAQPSRQQLPGRPGWPCVGKVDPSYIRISESTGGKVLMFQPGEVAGAGADLLASTSHDQLVFRAIGQLADDAVEYEIPIDSTIESVYFTISVQCLQSATIVRPSGEEVRVDAPDVDYNGFQAVRLFVIKAPAPGVWRVKAAGRGFLSVLVSARSDLHFDAGVVESGKPVPLPVAGAPQRLEAHLSGAATDIAFQFVSPTGTPMLSLPLAREGNDEVRPTYAAEITPPNAEYRIAVTGIDAKGFAFQRVVNRYFLIPR
jgi:hypothetical protein